MNKTIRQTEAEEPMVVPPASSIPDDKYSKTRKYAALGPVIVEVVNGKLVVIK